MSARGFPWLYGLIFRIYYFGNNTSGQTKHQKSHTSILLWKSDVQYTVIMLQCCCLQPLFNLALHVNVERLLVLARFLVNSHNQKLSNRLNWNRSSDLNNSFREKMLKIICDGNFQWGKNIFESSNYLPRLGIVLHASTVWYKIKVF